MPSTPTTAGEKPRRRWFRFGLRTMFVVVTAISLWLGYEVNWIRQRHAFLAKQMNIVRNSHPELKFGSHYFTQGESKAPGLLWMFGEKGFSKVMMLIRESEARERAPKPVDVDYVLADPDGEFRRAQILFPEAEIVAVGWDRSWGNEGSVHYFPITIKP